MAVCKLLWVMSLVVLATAAALKDTAKREVPAQEMNNIFTDESKRKLSDEVVSFGNQQNKPAGMIDDALAQDIKRETSNTEENKDTENHQAKRAPIMSEGEIETTPINEESLDSSELIENYLNTPDNLPESNFPDYSDMDGDFQNLRTNPSDTPGYEEALYGLGDGLGWPQYPPMLQDKYRRFRRFASINQAGQHQRRGIRSSLEQLLEANRGGRPKRDLRLSDEEIMNLLGYPSGSIERDQMMPESQEDYDTQEPEMLTPMNNMRYADPRLALYESLMEEEPYEPAYEGQEEELPEMPFMGPLMKRKLQRRGFYPQMDYRVLGDAVDGEIPWEDLQEEPFHKRRLQSSAEAEDDSELNDEEAQKNEESTYDEMGDMLHSGMIPEEVYRRLAL